MFCKKYPLIYYDMIPLWIIVIIKTYDNHYYDEDDIEVGKAVSCRVAVNHIVELTEEEKAESTVSPADVRAVLTALGGVMGDYMAQGRSVKLDGIGSFYFTAATNKNGIATEKEVTAALINGVRVRFIPETRFQGGGTRATGGGRRAVRGLTDVDIEWEEWKGKVEADSGSSSGGGENPLP